jgi:hypothetical protein
MCTQENMYRNSERNVFIKWVLELGTFNNDACSSRMHHPKAYFDPVKDTTNEERRVLI